MYFVCHRRAVSPFGATWRGLAPIGTGEGCLQAGMDSPNSWSTNNQAHVSASNHSNPMGTTHVPPSTRIRTRGSEYESHESPEDGHARLSNSAQDEVRDMRHAIAPHFYEDKSIMSHSNDGSHSNPTTTGQSAYCTVDSPPMENYVKTSLRKDGTQVENFYYPKSSPRGPSLE